jgi:hypothetical protein
MPKTRKIDYLYQRGSIWWLRLQRDGRDIGKSLGTADRKQAEIIALPLIAQHKAALLAARLHFENMWQHRFEPGREHAAPDGGRLIATDKELIHLNHNGAVIKIEPNGGPARMIVGRYATQSAAVEAARHANWNVTEAARPTVPTKNGNGDDSIFQTHLDYGGHKKTGVHGKSRREAESMWALFRQLTNGKPLEKCTRDDGRLIVRHLEAQGFKSATVHKKLVPLCAAVNLAIADGKLRFNPFASIAPQRDDNAVRLTLSGDDMPACRDGTRPARSG